MRLLTSPPARSPPGCGAPASSSLTRTPAATSRTLSVGGVVGPYDDLGRRPRCSTRPSSSAIAAPTSGVRTRTSPVAASQGGHVLLQHQPSAVEHADARGHLLDLGEQVAGQEDRGARAVEPEQQLADVADALRVQPVGRLVEHEQRGAPHQRRGQSEPLPHAQRVGLRRAPVAPGRAPPARAPRRCGARRRLAPEAAGAGRVEEREVGRAGQVRVGARSLDERADARQHRRGRPRHRLAEQLDLAGGGQHQPEQHPHRRGLARAVGAEEAVDVALAHVEVDAVDGAHLAVGLGQPAGCGSSGRSPRSPARRRDAVCQVLRRREQVAGVTVPASRKCAPATSASSTESGPTSRAIRVPGRRARAALAQLVAQAVGDEVAQRDGEQGGRPAAVDADRAEVEPRRRGEARLGHLRGRHEGRERVGARGVVQRDPAREVQSGARARS